ncbi:pyridoxamine 5'-phosphate oxidase family protein [Rubellicoccus peritrichatus]|uniref:Pyridoxamine 5'-phosphate oxidase family protein n=1 Tax=Rubellicoccus peritrichatus TaxID=3080537 RepID=A0AAQ3LJA3_9BACT|nr:pyridoxamine 5'-phosphate oxidase family protein [Puniceicoccus sp. CR14]WOO43219.1 pyridoxamine 5'-phosphate oxidase family protein [Puniceicoccus sp. CR14]
MGKVYDSIDDRIRNWILQQKMFFVATAPKATNGFVNCSPKGSDTLRVLDSHTLAYLDYLGSGIETVAHLKENGRIVIMMCAFEGSPKIFRFHGKGYVYEKESAEYASLSHHFIDSDGVGTRSIIKIEINRISDSCGWGVPLYQYQSDRNMMEKIFDEWGEEKVISFRDKMNRENIDGLAGYEG